jgi:hypothetical protein
MFMRPFLFIGAVIFSLYWFSPRSEIARVPGVLAPDEPVQRELFTSSFHEQNGYRIAPLATFDIRARVILAARYRFGREADLSPVDLVLAGRRVRHQCLEADQLFPERARLHLVDQSLAGSQRHDPIA